MLIVEGSGDPTLGHKPWGAGSEEMLVLAWAKSARDSGAGFGMMLVGLTLLPVGKPRLFTRVAAQECTSVNFPRNLCCGGCFLAHRSPMDSVAPPCWESMHVCFQRFALIGREKNMCAFLAFVGDFSIG